MKRTHCSATKLLRVCSALLLVPFATPSFAHNGEQDGKPLGPLVWVDDVGRTIGRALGGGTFGTSGVQLKIDGLSLIVPVDNKSECSAGQLFPFCDRFIKVGWGVAPIAFKEDKCRGEAYVTELTPGSDRAVGVMGQTLYIGDGTRKSTVVTVQSLWGSRGCEPLQTIPGSPPPSVPGWRVEKTLGLGTLFKPPFRLK
jgi:hypothetical protein